MTVNVVQYDNFFEYFFENSVNNEKYSVKINANNKIMKAAADYILKNSGDFRALEKDQIKDIITLSQMLFSNLYTDAIEAGTLKNFMDFMYSFATIPPKVRTTLYQSTHFYRDFAKEDD